MDLFADDGINVRTKFKEIYKRIDAVGKMTTDYIRRAVAEDAHVASAADAGSETPALFMNNARDQELVQSLYTIWEEHYVSDAENMREIRLHSTENGKKTIKNTLGMHVFFELTRLHALMRRVDLVTERDNLRRYSHDSLSTATYATLYTLKERTQSNMWIGIVNSFEPDLILATDKKGVDKDTATLALRDKLRTIWGKPILSLTQSETRLLIFFLTQQLEEVPTRDPKVVEEYRTVFQLVWLRVAHLTQETQPADVLDEENMRTAYPGKIGTYCFNRSYIAFCSIYLGEILQRFFFYDLIRPNATLNVPRPDILQASARAWVTRIVTDLAEEAFEDLFARTASEEGYNFVGDDTWFKYSYPNMTPGRGACIATFRPHLYKRFFSDAHVSKPQALVSNSVAARMFMINAVEEYIKMNAGHVHWKEAAVVANTDVADRSKLLRAGMCPFLVQVFSTYWVYDKGEVHVCDSIFEAIGVWFWLLRTRYDDTLFGSDIGNFVKEVLPASVQCEMAMAAFEL